MYKILKNLLPRKYPDLDWVQIEISSYCNGECLYCPHHAYGKNWKNAYLPLEKLRRFSADFKKTVYIHLQGWGEPFMHPDFIGLVKHLKKAGHRIGTTTNGTLLNRDHIKSLVEEGLDIIAFSLAGTDKKNDVIRKGASIGQVIRCIEDIHQIKASLNSDIPKVHIAFMLLKSGINDLPALPDFANNLGADQTVVSTLSLIVSRELESESFSVFSKDEYPGLKDQLLEVRKSGADKGVNIHFNIASLLNNPQRCSENIEKAMVINSDGGVSPCVMSNLPVEGNCYHYLKGEKQGLRNLTFGNVFEHSLSDIWNGKEYRDFRKSYMQSSCNGCLKLHIDNLLS